MPYFCKEATIVNSSSSSLCDDAARAPTFWVQWHLGAPSWKHFFRAFFNRSTSESLLGSNFLRVFLEALLQSVLRSTSESLFWSTSESLLESISWEPSWEPSWGHFRESSWEHFRESFWEHSESDPGVGLIVGTHSRPMDELSFNFIIIIITVRWMQWRLSWNRKQKIHGARLNLKSQKTNFNLLGFILRF